MTYRGRDAGLRGLCVEQAAPLPRCLCPVEHFNEVFSCVKCQVFQYKMFKSVLQNVQIFAKIVNFVHLQMIQLQLFTDLEEHVPIML